MIHFLQTMAQLLGDAGGLGIPNAPASTGQLGAILNMVYRVAAITAVIVIIVAGLIFNLSRGDANKVARARNAILYGVIGLVIVASAFAITNFVITKGT